MLRSLFRHKATFIGLILSLVTIIIAILAPWIAPSDPIKQNVFYRLTGPELSHLLGTDSYGRDILSRIVFGARVSLLIGICSVLFGILIGMTMGIIAGFKGGYLEALLDRIVDISMSFPTLVVGLVIMAILGSGLSKLIIAIGVAFAPRFARLAKGATLTVKEQYYIEASRSLGASDFHIITKHILPNIFGELLVMAVLWIVTAIRIEANLSFIGLGVNPPTPSWGGMISQGLRQLYNAPYISIFPGLAILITILSFNLLGDGLRDISDPKLRV